MENEIETPEDVKSAPAEAETSTSGLASKVLTPGEGSETPGERDMVTVHYSGWTTDGKLFDSSVKRGEPTSFPLNGVIKGWTEGMQLMNPGEKRRFWIPAELAYGENPGGGRPGGMLVFDIELLKIDKAPEPPQVPDDVAAVPQNAHATDSGLATRLLEEGEGGRKPKKDDVVAAHYSGWTTDGELFDSSVLRGQPVQFPLDRVIKGWHEALQMMSEGEKRRLWVPADLAYGDNPPPGAPRGMLVFDVQVLGILKP